jgi:hypothetical protein
MLFAMTHKEHVKRSIAGKSPKAKVKANFVAQYGLQST